MTEAYLGRGGTKQPVKLGKLLGEGASGKVYGIDQPGLAAKIYHTPEEARRYAAKIDAMLASPPALPDARRNGVAYPQIAWPQAKLHDRAGAFIGFLMPEIDFARSTSLVNLLQKNSRKLEGISEYYGYRVLVARNLASVFAQLHSAGHHMVDLKPANLRFYPATSWMAVVDADGFSIAGASGRLGALQLSDEYIAPESWGAEPGDLGVEQDLFALAAVIFQLLNNGVHPYAGTAPGSAATDLQTRIREGLYPYALTPRTGLKPSTASIHRMFRRTTRTMFDAAFLSGQRPDAVAWRDHLDALLKQLQPCEERPKDHVHFGAGCGFCGHDARVAAVRTAPRRTVAPRRPAARPLVRPTVRVQYSSPRIRRYAPHAYQPRTQRKWASLLVRGGALAVVTLGIAVGSSQLWQELATRRAYAETVNAALASNPPIAEEASADVTTQLGCPRDKICENGDVRAGDSWVEQRYRELLERADSGQREILMAGQRLWEDERIACNRLDAPVPCRLERSITRAAVLDDFVLGHARL